MPSATLTLTSFFVSPGISADKVNESSVSFTSTGGDQFVLERTGKFQSFSNTLLIILSISFKIDVGLGFHFTKVIFDSFFVC